MKEEHNLSLDPKVAKATRLCKQTADMTSPEQFFSGCVAPKPSQKLFPGGSESKIKPEWVMCHCMEDARST